MYFLQHGCILPGSARFMGVNRFLANRLRIIMRFLLLL